MVAVEKQQGTLVLIRVINLLADQTERIVMLA